MTDESTLEVVDPSGRLDVVESEEVVAAAVKKEKRRHRRVSLCRRRTLAFFGAAVIAGIGYFIWLQYENHQLIEQTHTLTKALVTSGDRHHASTVKSDSQLQEALDGLKASAAVIEYEGGVITYQNGEIIAAQQSGHATLTQMQALQSELGSDFSSISAALEKGQAQINAYLGYLTCLSTNQSNTAVCGAAPALPS